MNVIQQEHDLSICYQDNCIHANGKQADLIGGAIALGFVFLGLAALAKATN